MSKSENQEAEQFADWLRLKKYRFSHIANESGQKGTDNIVIMMARKKRMGVSKGVPDYMICLKRGSLLFIELKRARKRKKNGELVSPSTDGIDISSEQTEWIEALNKIDNVEATICFGFEEARKYVLECEK